MNLEVMPRLLLLDGTEEQIIPARRKYVDAVSEH